MNVSSPQQGKPLVKWWLIVVAVLVVLAALALRLGLPHRAEVTRPAIEPPRAPAEDRLSAARVRAGEAIRRRCADAGISYPPRDLFLRAFKDERTLEAWGRADSEAFRLVATWPVLAASGHSGPKRMEGDRQVPEGVYRVAVFNPRSSFHLSLGLDYPNASDRVRSDSVAPGSDIYIHGGAASIGCLAIGDGAVEELFVLAKDTADGFGTVIPVHIFPKRMAGDAWSKFRAAHPQYAGFWAELEPIYGAFEQNRRVPSVSVASDGRYQLAGTEL